MQKFLLSILCAFMIFTCVGCNTTDNEQVELLQKEIDELKEQISEMETKQEKEEEKILKYVIEGDYAGLHITIMEPYTDAEMRAILDKEASKKDDIVYFYLPNTPRKDYHEESILTSKLMLPDKDYCVAKYWGNGKHWEKWK